MAFPRFGTCAYRDVDGIRQRKCGGCGTWKPYDADHFHRNRTNPSGLQSHCKTCQRAAAKPAAIRQWLRQKAQSGR